MTEAIAPSRRRRGAAIAGPRPIVADDARIPPLVVQIATELGDGILAGKYRPGDRIREQEVADTFGVSRAPVREAIRLLEIDGLIATEHWRGARVVTLSVDEMDDLFETLGALLGLVAKLAARHGARTDISRFSAAVDAMHKAHYSKATPVERLKFAYDAGKVLREMCGSARAGDMLLRTSRVAFLNHRIVQQADDTWQEAALALWRPLAAAIADRRAEDAETFARAIIRHTQDFTMPQLRDGSVTLAGSPDPIERPDRAKRPALRPARASRVRSTVG